MELSLELKQTQKLSPQRIQSMAILQMGIQELQMHVEKELLENPTLELEQDVPKKERSELLQKMEWLTSTDRQNRWYHKEDSLNLMDYIAASEEVNLYDHLRTQFNMETLPPRLGIAVDCVLSGLNGNGYLDESVEELSARCGQPVEIIVRAEMLVRGLEPAGIAARTLSECLVFQLERKNEFGLAMTIAKDFLEEVAKDHYALIAQKTGATRAEVVAACDQIRELEPRPGARFSPREAPGYIIPDVVVTEQNGALIVAPGDDFLPELKVSEYYRSMMKSTDDSEVKSYLEDRVKNAAQLIKNIEQRRNTLLDCVRIIVDRQMDFFEDCKGNLRPLTMQEVAAKLGIHESTVSRAVKSKYIQCSRGSFPINHFFSRSVSAGEGKMSSAEVKNTIRELVEQEDRRKPISDQKICDMLAKRKIYISRRAVAKYREEIGIPSSAGRKRY